MSTSSVTELVSYFAGYLHIAQEAARTRIDYEEFLSVRLSDDFVPGETPGQLKDHGLDELKSRPMPVPFEPEKPSLIDASPSDIFSDWSNHSYAAASPARDFLNFQIVGSAPGSAFPGFSLSEVKISVSYGQGGSQLAFNAHQSNMMLDDDVVLASGWTTTDTRHDAGYMAAVEDMNAQADAAQPAELALPGYDAQTLQIFVSAYDSAWKAEAEPHGTTIVPGVYVNGVLQPEGVELPSEPEVQNEEVSRETPAQMAELGGNIATNAALIVDVNHAVGTLVVVQDYFRTDAIIQTIAYMDSDTIGYGGTAEPIIVGGGNQAYNIATFSNNDPGVAELINASIFAGLTWNVDVIDGDLYDIQTTEQVIWLQDNDLTVQANYQSSYHLVTGTNELGNFASLVTIGENYDLVIVLGSAHEFNLINQKLVLLDNDWVVVSGDPTASDGAPGPTISTGDNLLQNDASIEQFGSQTFLPLTPIWESLISELNDQAGELDTSFGWGIPNFGTEPLDILFITGDLWDINALSQTVVVVDVDAGFQFLPEDYAGEGVAQSVSTGGNSLNNSAAIVDTGPLAGTHVGGDVYDDDVLIQAEIVVSEQDEIVYGDTDALVSELIAFTDTVENTEQADGNVAGPDANSTHDFMGSLLT